MKPVLFLSIGIFILEMLMKHGIFLIGWLRIAMNLRLVVLIPTTHPLPNFLLSLLLVSLGFDLGFSIYLLFSHILVSLGCD